jgi:hypothetical protein
MKLVGSIKCRGFLDKLRHCKLLKKGPVPHSLLQLTDCTSISVRYSLVIFPDSIFLAMTNAAKHSTSTSQAKEFNVGSSSNK